MPLKVNILGTDTPAHEYMIKDRTKTWSTSVYPLQAL